MFLKCISRAAADTKEFFGWNKRTLIMPLLFLFGMWMHSQWTLSHVEPFMQLLTWITYTVFPAGAFAILLFFWNLYWAPIRIEREAHEKTKKLVPEPWDESFEPQLPSHEKILSNILNRKETFSLREAALLLADRKLVGEMSETALAQLAEIKRMVRDGKIDRWDDGTIAEKMPTHSLNQIIYMISRSERPVPPSGARITRKSLYDLSIELGLPIPGLKP